MLSLQIFIADLESKYQQIKNEKNNRRFYLKLADYGKCLLVNEITLSSILLPLYQESKIDCSDYNKACKNYAKNIKFLARDLIEKAREANIIDDDKDSFSKQIQNLKEYLRSYEVTYFFDTHQYPYREYDGLIKKFRDAGKINLIQKKHFYSDGSQILWDLYNNVLKEWDKYESIRDIKVWWAHYNVIRLACGVLNLKEKKYYFKEDNEIDKLYKDEFNQINESDSGDLIIIKRHKFDEWIDLLHRYLAPRLKELAEGEVEVKPKTVSTLVPLKLKDCKIVFEDARGVIRIDDKDVVLPAFKNEHSLCRAMFKHKPRELVDWSEIYEDMGWLSETNSFVDKKKNRTIYDTMNRINGRIKLNIKTDDNLFSWQEKTIKRNF